MEGDLDGVVVVAGDVPCRRLQQRIDEEGGEAIALLVVEIALDEGDVAHGDGTGQVEVVGRCGGGDGCSPRVVTDRCDGQSRPGWHCPDPTSLIGVFPAIGVSRGEFPGT